MLIEEHGYVGNVWVRQNYMEKAGDSVGGHVHFFDHVSLLAKGSVEVSVDDQPPRRFEAPTFLVIRKGRRHKITALVDDTSWYCVFAARDLDGEVTEVVDRMNDPWFTYAADDDYWEKHDPSHSPSLK